MNIFQWLAGADKNILQQCSNSEKTKITGFGTLVLIPAIVGFFSMTYAISTITNVKLIYFIGGIVWFFIVLFIDRFIISTMYRTKLKDSSANFYLAVFARYIFAIFVGIAVAHPMTLLWFKDSITEEIKLEKDNLLKSEEDQFQNTVTTLNIPLNNLRERRKCLKKLLTAERSGIKIIENCGVSSGRPGYAGRAKELEKQIKELDSEIINLQNQINNRVNEVKEEKNRRKSNIDTYSKADYLKRVKALTKLEKGENGEHIKEVAFFIILFFIFIDILPITMKIATPYGEYEAIRDTQTFKVLEMEATQREVIQSVGKNTYLNISKAKFKGEEVISEISEITKSANTFTELQEVEREKFNKNIKKIQKNIKNTNDQNLKKDLINYLINTRQIFYEALSKAQNKFLTYLQRL